jgi:hypothetical protein
MKQFSTTFYHISPPPLLSIKADLHDAGDPEKKFLRLLGRATKKTLTSTQVYNKEKGAAAAAADNAVAVVMHTVTSIHSLLLTPPHFTHSFF